eukprot:GFUD01016440.1.p1 GENE.GFUD01016440.1~~GFUD01016440.1.p1  ORF type:complete len:102 (-),score=13.17 GFUD01016440.1:193-498(-)
MGSSWPVLAMLSPQAGFLHPENFPTLKPPRCVVRIPQLPDTSPSFLHHHEDEEPRGQMYHAACSLYCSRAADLNQELGRLGSVAHRDLQVSLVTVFYAFSV